MLAEGSAMPSACPVDAHGEQIETFRYIQPPEKQEAIQKTLPVGRLEWGSHCQILNYVSR